MSTEDNWPRSVLNAKYRSMPGEFLYKGNQWVSWTSEQIIRRVEDQFQFWPSDVILSGYPKSGNTLLSEMVSLLVRSQGQKSKWAETLKWAHSYPIFNRVVFIEEIYQWIYPSCTQITKPMDYLEQWTTEGSQLPCRLIKTHLPADSIKCALDRVDQSPRIVYVYRNPKDVCVSMFHFYRGAQEYGPFAGDWDEFLHMWLDGWIAAGNWCSVVPEWLKFSRLCTRPGNRILCLSYESLVREPMKCVQRLHRFLNPHQPLDPEVSEAICEHTSFERMRKNPQTNYENVDGFVSDFEFMRRGEIGDWKRWFTAEQSNEFDRIYESCVDQVNQLVFPEKLIFE
ncbi:Aryl sulfotransferase [Fasciola hepatica]|uniref:Aryl sulfotransferase n=1 Tax=Fasciola hepatica TaxID=6192 RepID=A0A2H1CAB8_FASHE|nr:Aryl sulfotransferase [Fasciola hepatica]